MRDSERLGLVLAVLACAALLLMHCDSGPATDVDATQDARLAVIETGVVQLGRTVDGLLATGTPGESPTVTGTRTHTPTATPTATALDLATATRTSTPTPTVTPAPTLTPCPTATQSAPELTIEFLNTAKPGSRLQSIITYTGVEAQIGLYLPTGTDLYWEDTDPHPNLACGKACWDVEGSATIRANIWFNKTDQPGEVYILTLFWKTASGGNWSTPVAVQVGGGTIVFTATPTATATRTPAPAQTWRGGQWTRIGPGPGSDLEFLLLPAGDGRFWFCPDPIQESCCTWWDADAAWGTVRVNHATPCGPIAWVYAPNTVSVRELRWQ